MAGKNKKISSIIQLMAAEAEDNRIISEFSTNKTLLGQIRTINANTSRFTMAGERAVILFQSLKGLRTATKLLKDILKDSGTNDMPKFLKRVSSVIDFLDDHEDVFKETMDELNTVGIRITGVDPSYSDDDDDNHVGSSSSSGPTVEEIKNKKEAACAANLKRIANTYETPPLRNSPIKSRDVT